MKYFIFTINDIKLSNDKTISALTIIDTLLSREVWLFRKNAPLLKKLCVGNKVLLYVCGVGRRFFYAEIEITSLPEPIKSSQVKALSSSLCLNWMSHYCTIKLIGTFDTPVPIKPIIGELDFIADKHNYGLNLRLPIVNIDYNDYAVIKTYSSSQKRS